MTTPHPDRPRIPSPEVESSQDRASREASLFEGRQYADEAQRHWDNRIFTIKLDYLNVFSKLGLWAVRAIGVVILLVLLYMIVLLLVHYTMPGLGWLVPSELTRLEDIYGEIAAVGAPIMLMTNAWVIWWMSRTRRNG